jgi:hypothetical protein
VESESNNSEGLALSVTGHFLAAAISTLFFFTFMGASLEDAICVAGVLCISGGLGVGGLVRAASARRGWLWHVVLPLYSLSYACALVFPDPFLGKFLPIFLHAFPVVPVLSLVIARIESRR